MKGWFWARAMILAVLLLATPGCVLPAAEPAAAPSEVESQPVIAMPQAGSQEGVAAPAFSLADVDGRELALADLRGQVVMLNFWAVWCGFCLSEMPEIQAAHEVYQNQGFTVLGIDVQDEADVVRQFREDVGLTFPLLLDSDARVTRAYQVRGLPTSMFINQEGAIFAVHVGPLDQAAIARYLAQVGVN